MSGSACSEPQRYGAPARGVVVGFLAVVAAAPIPLGANRPLPWSLLALALGLLLVLWAVDIFRRGGLGPPRALIWLAGLWLVAPLWAVVQALPWTPTAWHHPLWQAVAPAHGAVAADPARAVEGAMRLLMYGAGFLLAFGVTRGHGTARRMVLVLAAVPAAVAMYGLVILLGGFETILVWDKWTYRGVLTATFVNRNAAATFFGFGLLAAAALLLRRLHEKPSRLEARLRAAGPPAAALTINAVALLLTQSRAGTVAALAGLGIFFGVMAMVRRPPVSVLVLGGVLVMGGGVTVVTLAGSGVGGRLAVTDLDALDRVPVHAAVLDGIAARPWTGHGLGSFNLAFPAFRPPTLDQHWDKAHSSYLENAFELGLPAGGALYGALAGAALLCARGVVRRRRRQEYAALGLAAAVLAALHATVDFTLQMPANALWLAVLLGLGVAQSSPTRRATTARASGRSAKARR